MSLREEYLERLKGRLKEWNLELDRFEARVQRASADVKARYEAQISQLRQKGQDMQQKLSNALAASEGAWGDLREALEKARRALGEGLRKAKSEFGRRDGPPSGP